MFKEKKVEVYSSGITSGQPVIGKDEKGIDQKEFVRQCFQGLITKLRSKKRTLKGKSLVALERLLNNLETSGLINPDKEEPASQTEYSYDQTNSKCFIDWRF